MSLHIEVNAYAINVIKVISDFYLADSNDSLIVLV